MKNLKRIKLILNSAMLNNKDIEILMESLSNKPLELLHLDLDENFLDDKGVSILCKKIEEFGEL